MTRLALAFLTSLALGAAVSAAADTDDAATLDGIDVAAGDIEVGAELYRAECAQCHGRTARGMASFPRLSGKEADYIAERLVQYRAGEPVGPNSALMFPVAEDLTDEDIAALAVYLSETYP